MKKAQPNTKYDPLIWVCLIFVLATLSYAMLVRDSKKQYGALAFGNFPEFTSVESNGIKFDQHRFHEQLSAVIIGDDPPAEEILSYLEKISQVTAMGRKYLHSLIFVSQNSQPSNQWVQYLTLEEEPLKKLKEWRKGLFKEGIILVDQNGIIRGIFDLEDKLDRINFEGAVKGIL